MEFTSPSNHDAVAFVGASAATFTSVSTETDAGTFAISARAGTMHVRQLILVRGCPAFSAVVSSSWMSSSATSLSSSFQDTVLTGARSTGAPQTEQRPEAHHLGVVVRHAPGDNKDGLATRRPSRGLAADSHARSNTSTNINRVRR